MTRGLLGIVAAGLLMAVTAPTAMAQNTVTPAPPSQGAFDHLSILVADQNASVRFYTEVFGLTEFNSAVTGPRWLRFENGVELHLIAGRTEPVADVLFVHMAIRTADLDPIMEKLKARGMMWTDSTRKPGAINNKRTDGVRQIFLRDPDGYWIEVNDAAKLAK